LAEGDQVKLSSAIISGMQTLRLTPANPDCDIFGTALRVVEPTPSWPADSATARYEAILGYWPWLERNIPVPGEDHYRSLMMEIEYRFDQQVCRGYTSLSDLLNYIRSLEPACGECCSFGCICGEVAPLFRELVQQQNREIQQIGAPIHPSDESTLPHTHPEPPPPATSPIGQEAADEFEGIPLDSLPPSMRRAVFASRLRVQASIEETARRATTAVESPTPALELAMKDSIWQRAQKSGRRQADIWKRAAQSRFSKLTLTQILLIAILVVLVGILCVDWQRNSGPRPYFRSTPRSHHGYPS
jgi:hypothetical protein